MPTSKVPSPQPPNGKSKTKALAIGVITGIFLCAMGYEIIQYTTKESSVEQENPSQSLHIPKTSSLAFNEDELEKKVRLLTIQNRLQTQKVKGLQQELMDLEHKIHELKIALHLGKNSEKEELAAVGQLYAEKHYLNDQLQAGIWNLKEELEKNHEQISSMEKIVEYLTDQIEIQHIAKEKSNEKFQQHKEHLLNKYETQQLTLAQTIQTSEETQFNLQKQLEEQAHLLSQLNQHLSGQISLASEHALERQAKEIQFRELFDLWQLDHTLAHHFQNRHEEKDQEIQALDEKRRQIASKFKAFRQRLDNQETILALKELELDSLVQLIHASKININNELKALQAERRNIQNDHELTEKHRKELENELKEAEQNIVAIQYEIERLKVDKEWHEIESADLIEEKKKMEELYLTSIHETVITEDLLAQIFEELKENQSKISHLQNELSSLQTTLSEKASNMEFLENSHENLKSEYLEQVSNLTTTCENERNKNEILSKEKEELSKLYLNELSENQNYEDLFAVFSGALEQHKRNIEKLETSRDKLLQEIDLINQEVLAAKKETQEYASYQQAAEFQIQELLSEKSKVTNSYLQELFHNQQWESIFNKLSNSLKEHKEDIESYAQKHQNLLEENKRLLEDLSEKDRNIHSLRHKAIKHSSRNKRLAMQNKELLKELEAAKQKFSEELESLREKSIEANSLEPHGT